MPWQDEHPKGDNQGRSARPSPPPQFSDDWQRELRRQVEEHEADDKSENRLVGWLAAFSRVWLAYAVLGLVIYAAFRLVVMLFGR